MYFLSCFLLSSLASQSIRAEINVKDYVYWTKADIAAWHQYFPSRQLEQERLTIQKASETVTSLVDNMKTSLAATVRYQDQELSTAQFIMEGTSAQGCINGISTYMERAVDEGVDYFQDCVADVPSYLQRTNASWTKTNVSYSVAYQRALAGIDICARTYPNRDSWNRLRTCVEAWINNYFTAANKTNSDIYWSKAMGVVASTVGSCAQAAANGVVSKGYKFLTMLVQCAKLSENVDYVTYEEELTSEFNKYLTLNDLTTQVWLSMVLNYNFIKEIEQQMIYYYDLQKRALEKYVIESRDAGFYYGQMVGYLRRYLSAVAAAARDNPDNDDCVSEANDSLQQVFYIGAAKALECDRQIVNNTKFLIARVNDYFSRINNILPYTGNVAILSCMEEGYIFAEQTIRDCSFLAFNDYKINITELNSTIIADVGVLLGYERSFFSNSSLPCGESILNRAYLEANRTLYNLQRCLYISKGAKYAVTTYTPSTTVTTTSTTPSTTPAWATITTTGSPSTSTS